MADPGEERTSGDRHPEDRPANFRLLVGEGMAWKVMDTLLSPITVLPVFVHELTPSKLAVGLIRAVYIFCWTFPQVVVAHYTDRLDRKKRFVVASRLLAGVPFLALGLLVYLGILSGGRGILLAFFAALVVFSSLAGGSMVAWVALVGSIIRQDVRGRFYGMRALFGAIAGVFASYFLIREMLARVSYPLNFAVLFAASSVCAFIGVGFLSRVREKSGPTAEKGLSFFVFLRSIPGRLREDKGYALFVLAVVLAVFGGGGQGMAGVFYSLYALDVLGLAKSEMGTFTALLVVTELGGALSGGYLADRKGPVFPYALSLACGLLAAANACWVRSMGGMCVTFAAVGLSLGMQASSYHNMILALAPTHLRGTYLGMTNFLQSPFLALGPILGGLIVKWTSFEVLFRLAAVGSACALVAAISFLLEHRENGARQRARKDTDQGREIDR
ncbi:MAG: MFS transporter [Planctomycetota bacterium]